MIQIHNWVICAVGKDIISDQSSIFIKFSIADIRFRINKPTRLRIIIPCIKIIQPALEVIQPRLGVIVVPAVSERIERTDSVCIYCYYMVAPCVVLVLSFEVAGLVVNGGDIPLCVLEIVILRVVVLKPYNAGCTVEVFDSAARSCLSKDFASVKSVCYVTELTPFVLNKLISKIAICCLETVDGQKQQEISVEWEIENYH